MQLAPVQAVKLHDDLWERMRDGFGVPDVESALTAQWQNWYLARPAVLNGILERSRIYLFHIVEELAKRGMPMELALLPMVESGYNPTALSSAQALGLWQFIPSTGKIYKLEQGPDYDARRDVIASTEAALGYLGTLNEMFGDWHLALASYNWGENAVARAIERNKARGMATDYASLVMPDETRNYVPKLMALKRIIANPAAFKLALEPLPNRPYFTTVARAEALDINVTARLAEMKVEELRALNPAHTVAAGTGKSDMVLPVDRAPIYQANFETYVKQLAALKPANAKLGPDKLAKGGLKSVPVMHQVKAGETVFAIARKYGTTEAAIKVWNPIVEAGLLAGQKLFLHLN